MKVQYEYITFSAAMVISMFAAPIFPDAYIAEDAESLEIKTALDRGFRWIRTDGDVAVFERKTFKYPALERRP